MAKAFVLKWTLPWNWCLDAHALDYEVQTGNPSCKTPRRPVDIALHISRGPSHQWPRAKRWEEWGQRAGIEQCSQECLLGPRKVGLASRGAVSAQLQEALIANGQWMFKKAWIFWSSSRLVSSHSNSWWWKIINSIINQICVSAFKSIDVLQYRKLSKNRPLSEKLRNFNSN